MNSFCWLINAAINIIIFQHVEVVKYYTRKRKMFGFNYFASLGWLFFKIGNKACGTFLFIGAILTGSTFNDSNEGGCGCTVATGALRIATESAPLLLWLLWNKVKWDVLTVDEERPWLKSNVWSSTSVGFTLLADFCLLNNESVSFLNLNYLKRKRFFCIKSRLDYKFRLKLTRLVTLNHLCRSEISYILGFESWKGVVKMKKKLRRQAIIFELYLLLTRWTEISCVGLH